MWLLLTLVAIPTHNGSDIPIISFQPDWRTEPVMRLSFGGIIREALDTSEQRIGTRPRPLYGLSYKTVGLSARETGYARKFFELAGALPVGCPFWTDQVCVLDDVTAGDTSLSVDDTTGKLFSVFNEFAVLWKSFNEWEVVELDEVGESTVTLAAAVSGNYTTRPHMKGQVLLVPLAYGKVARPGTEHLTDEHGALAIDFEEVFHGLTDQGTVEPPPPGDLTTTQTACRDTFTLRFERIRSETRYEVQIADSSSGPWTTYIEETPPFGSGTREITINNIFEGAKWFRVRSTANTRHVTRSVRPEAATVAPPSVSLTGFTETPFEWAVGPFTSLADSGNFHSNSLIALDETYVEITDRVHYDISFAEGGAAVGATLTADEPGAVIKWTIDNTDPTEDTVNPTGSGWADDRGFGLVIRARCFAGGCRSPEVVILVDKLWDQLSNLTVIVRSGSANGACDLPRTNPFPGGPDLDDSGNACTLFGGTAAYTAGVVGAACGGLTTAPSVSRVVETGTISTGSGFSAPYPTHTAVYSWAGFHAVEYNRLPALDYYPEVHNFGYVKVTQSSSVIYSDAFQCDGVSGAGGSATPVEDAIDLSGLVEGCGFTGATKTLSHFGLLMTRYATAAVA